MLPFVSRYDFNAGTLFPVLWWDVERKDDTLHGVLPLYFYRDAPWSTTFLAGAGLAGYYREGAEKNHWFVPFYAWAYGNFFSIPYSHVRHGGQETEAYLCGLAGRTADTNGVTTAHWLYPLYGKTPRKFGSIPLVLEWDREGALVSWFSLPTLSSGWQQGDTWYERYLIALAGREVNRKTNYGESWFAPFYYANSRGDLVTPVYGKSGDRKWGLPCWYADGHTFASPLWYHHTDDKDRIDRWMIPLLLSGGVYRDGSRRNGFLLNLAGYRSDDTGYRASWFAPFYFHDNEDTFVTPLYGYHGNAQWCFPLWYNDERMALSPVWCQRRNADGRLGLWSVPLLLSGGGTRADGSRSVGFLLGLGGATWGGKDGYRQSWAFPFYYENSKNFLVTPLGGYDGSEGSSWILPLYYYDGPTGDYASLLCGRLKRGASADYWWLTPLVGTHAGAQTGAWFFPLFNWTKDAAFDRDLARLDAPTLPGDIRFTNKVVTAHVNSKIRGSVLLGADFDHTVTGRVGESHGKGRSSRRDVYELEEHVKKGNRLFFNNEGSRKVAFDIATRRKTSDTRASQTMALCGLFYRTHKADTVKGTSHVHTRVLWKLWDREETNGDVTLDAFPAFTYDSRKNGYSKTSFLWRFFRYEKDPQTGTKLDLLFLPILR